MASSEPVGTAQRSGLRTARRPGVQNGTRGQLIAAASQWFRRRGYPNVSLQAVAESVGVTAPAVYRHFPGKQALLDAAISRGLDAVEADLDSPDASTAGGALALLAHTAVQFDDLWILMRRESKHLSADQRAVVQRRFVVLLSRLEQLIAEMHPDESAVDVEWRARSVLAVLAAPSQYGQSTSTRQTVEWLRRIAGSLLEGDRVGDLSDDQPRSQSVRQPFEPPSSRREEVIHHATALFAKHGYPNVSVNDIGSAARIAGPSIYHHFASKDEILLAVFRRAVDWIEFDQMRTAREGRDAREKLRLSMAYYAALALEHQDLFTIFTNETVNLDRSERRSIGNAHRRFINGWVGLLAEVRHDVSAAEAHLLVTAALCVINDLSGAGRIMGAPGAEARLVEVAFSVLMA